MIWLLAAMLVLIGIYFIVRKEDVARGEALVMGGNLPPGCALAQGLILIAMGILIWTGELTRLNAEAQSWLEGLGLDLWDF